ncbi:MAG: HlyD family secretion protein [Proteobacteria bacterium]|nr:HlyD family secretion protein [Pseudomonadota bacterium]
MSRETVEKAGEAEDESGTGPAESSTSAFLSWNTLRFIKSPPDTLFLYPALGLILSLALGFAGTFFIPVSSTIPVSGALFPEQTWALASDAGGTLDVISGRTGEFLEKGSPYARMREGGRVKVSQSGVLVRKVAMEGGVVRRGDPLAILGSDFDRWIIRAQIEGDRLTDLKKGQDANLQIAAVSDRGLGQLKGELLDWSDAGEGKLALLIRVIPEPGQGKILRQSPESFYGSPVSVQLLGAKRPLSSLLAAAIFGGS